MTGSYKYLDKLLKMHRTRTKLTQKKLGDLARLSATTIRNYENGVGKPKSNSLKALIEVFLNYNGFLPGMEIQEAVALWKSSPAYNNNEPFDEIWLSHLLDTIQREDPFQSTETITNVNPAIPTHSPPSPLNQLKQAETDEDWDRVIEIGETILNRNNRYREVRGRTAKAYYQRSIVYINDENIGAAVDDLTRAIELAINKTTLGNYYFQRGKLYQDVKYYKQSRDDFEIAAQLGDQEAQGEVEKLEAGYAAQEKAKAEKNRKELLRELDLVEHQILTYGEKETDYRETHISKLERAIWLCEKLLYFKVDQQLLKQKLAEYLCELGGILFRRIDGEWKIERDFKECINKAIRYNPEYISAYKLRGRFYYKRKKYAEALSDFLYVTQHELEDKNASNYLGLVYLECQEYDKALEVFNHLFNSSNTSEEKSIALYGRGMTYKAKGDKRKARLDFSSAAFMGNKAAKDILREWWS